MTKLQLTPAEIEICRRDVLAAGSAVLLLAMTGQAAAQNAQTERAKPGDRIIFAAGEHQGKPARIELLVPGNPPIAALPADPVTGTVRDGSRFNKLLLLRVNPDELDAETRSRAIDGVLAYSAICTHQGCTLNAWNKEARLIQCFCHHSEFSPAAGGRPTKGPATASLPLLPLTVADGALVVAADFTSKPGPRTNSL
jgi:rieske iron-sulfur protein